MRSAGESQTEMHDQDRQTDRQTAASLPWSSKSAPSPAHFPAWVFLRMPLFLGNTPRTQVPSRGRASLHRLRLLIPHVTDLIVAACPSCRSYGFCLIINQLNKFILWWHSRVVFSFCLKLAMLNITVQCRKLMLIKQKMKEDIRHFKFLENRQD
jgi:hypothetical protein